MMNNNEIDRDTLITKLREMKLPAFANALNEQLDTPNEYEKMSFLQRLQLLVDTEFEAETNHRIARLIKNSNVPIGYARLSEIKYKAERHINPEIIQILQSNKYIGQKLNVIIMGATGVGKTYIASALTINACEAGYKSKFIRYQRLMRDFEAARVMGTYQKTLEIYSKIPLLVIDDFLLTDSNDVEATDLLELMEGRCGKTSTIFCSQFQPSGWYKRLEKGYIADSILDRIIPQAYKLTILGDSMRIIDLPGTES